MSRQGQLTADCHDCRLHQARKTSGTSLHFPASLWLKWCKMTHVPSKTWRCNQTSPVPSANPDRTKLRRLHVFHVTLPSPARAHQQGAQGQPSGTGDQVHSCLLLHLHSWKVRKCRRKRRKARARKSPNESVDKRGHES